MEYIARAGSRCAHFSVHKVGISCMPVHYNIYPHHFLVKNRNGPTSYNIIEGFWRRGKSLWGGTLVMVHNMQVLDLRIPFLLLRASCYAHSQSTVLQDPCFLSFACQNRATPTVMKLAL